MSAEERLTKKLKGQGEASNKQRVNEHLTREYQSILRRLAEAEIEVRLEDGSERTTAAGKGGEKMTSFPAEHAAEGEGAVRDDLPVPRSICNGVSSPSPTVSSPVKHSQTVGNLSSSSNSTASLSSASLEERVSRTAQEPSLLSQVQALQGDAVALVETISRGAASVEEVRVALASMQDSHGKLVAAVATVASSLDRVNEHSGGRAARHIATSHTALRKELHTLARHLRELEESLRTNSGHLTSGSAGSPPPQNGYSTSLKEASDGSPYLPDVYLTPAPPPRSTNSLTSSPPSSCSSSSFPSLSLLLDMFTPNGSTSLVDSTVMAADTPGPTELQEDIEGRREGGDGGERENDDETGKDKGEEKGPEGGVVESEDTPNHDGGGSTSADGYHLPSSGRNSSVLEWLQGGRRSAGPGQSVERGEERHSPDAGRSPVSGDEWDGDVDPLATGLLMETPPTNLPWLPRSPLTPEPTSPPQPLPVSSPCADSGISGSDAGHAPSSHPPILPSSLPSSYNSGSHGGSDVPVPPVPLGISASDIEALRSELADLRQKIRESSEWGQSIRQHGATSDPTSSLPALEEAAVFRSASTSSTVHTPSVSKPFQMTTVSRPYYTPTTSRPEHTAAVSRPYCTLAVSRPYYTPTVSRPYYTSTVSRPYHTVASKTSHTHSASDSIRHTDSTPLHPHHPPLTPSHRARQPGYTSSSQRRLFPSSSGARHGEMAGEREASSRQREKTLVSSRETGPPASISRKGSTTRRTYSVDPSPPKMVTCATQTTFPPAHSHTDSHPLVRAHSGTKKWNSGAQTGGGFTLLHSHQEPSFSLPQASSTPRHWTHLLSMSSSPSQPTGSTIKRALQLENHSPAPPLREQEVEPPPSPPLSLPSSSRHNTKTVAPSKSSYVHTTTLPARSSKLSYLHTATPPAGSSKSSYLHTTTPPAWSSKLSYLHTATDPSATSSLLVQKRGTITHKPAPPRHPSSMPHSSAPQPRHAGGKRPSSSSSSSSPSQYSSLPQATHSSTSYHLLPGELSLHSAAGHTPQSHS